MGERGAVYVEFLIVFLPIFLLFLAVCQLALLAAARLTVQHAALNGARSAIVILEDDPKRYGGARRGSLSTGDTGATPTIEGTLASLGLLAASDQSPHRSTDDLGGTGAEQQVHQQGARMTSIREAVEFPLLSLAPLESSVVRPQDGSVGSSIGASLAKQLLFDLTYTRAATVVTVHENGADVLAADQLDRNAVITVRVTYLYACGVPLVRALLCRSLDALLGSKKPRVAAADTELGKRIELAEDRGGLRRLAGPGSFFAPLHSEATLPNQGAAYEHEDGP